MGITMSPRFNRFNTGTDDFVTFGRQFQRIAEVMPDETAIMHIRRDDSVQSITWKELHTASNQLAWKLMERGIGPGERVLVFLPNGVEHIVAMIGIWKTGACYVPVTSKCPLEVQMEIFRLVPHKAIFCDCELETQALCITAKSFWEDLQGYSQEMPPDIQAVPNMISLSGGTSGKVKLLQQNIPAGMGEHSLEYWLRMSGQDYGYRQLITGPMFHGAPHAVARIGLFIGNTTIFCESLKPENIARYIRDYQVDYVQMVPTLMYRIYNAENVDRNDFKRLKALYHTGGYCAPFLKQAWIDMLAPEKIYEVYSMTEVIGMTYIRGDEWLRHRNSVGKCEGGVISIRDGDFQELPPYAVGEIYFKAYPQTSLSIDYVNQQQLETINDGFRSVGDLGFVDEDGYLYFVDRRNDIIVTGGENVSASEVENVLIMHPDVEDAVVIGIPDDEWGRRVHAIVACKHPVSAETLRAFMAQHLTSRKIPGSFEFVEQLPRKESGKIDRDALLKKYVQ
ncbi:MAG: bile acid--CoA ligase BaiB [Oscillospiraceae bacterium]